ncbi:hypothetical protein ACFXTO_016382 [Malus domestica]
MGLIWRTTAFAVSSRSTAAASFRLHPGYGIRGPSPTGGLQGPRQNGIPQDTQQEMQPKPHSPRFFLKSERPNSHFNYDKSSSGGTYSILLSLSHKQQQTVFFLNSPSTPRSHGKAATPRFPRRLSRTHGCGKWQEHATSPLLTCCCIISTNSSMHSLDSLE